MCDTGAGAWPFVRSVMSVPGSTERFLAKAQTIPADAVMFDLEDSVAPADKEVARHQVAGALAAGRQGPPLRWVRVNGVASGHLEEDLVAVVGPQLDGIVLPKADRPEALQRLDHYLHLLESTRRLGPGSIRVVALIESAEGLANVEAVCRATPRLAAAMFGAEDYAASLGLVSVPDPDDLRYTRYRIVNAAKASGLAALDSAVPHFGDGGRFEDEARCARRIGYTGKLCIHPDQVGLANGMFGPDEDELAWAERTVRGFEAAGGGAVTVDGAMVDLPVYARARAVLDRAQRSRSPVLSTGS